MTPEKKQEINRVIAEEMGYEQAYLDDKLDRYVWVNSVGRSFGPHCPVNPVDSISDALEAVDEIVPWSYSVDIYKSGLSGLYNVRLTVWIKDSIKGKLFIAEAETRPAAVSLALVQYIKEEE